MAKTKKSDSDADYIGGQSVDSDIDSVADIDSAAFREVADQLMAYARSKGLEPPNAYINAAQMLMSVADEAEAK